MKTFAIFFLSKETFTIRTCSILDSFFRKLLSKATLERKLSSVSLPLLTTRILNCLMVPRRNAAQRTDQALLFYLRVLDYISSPGRRKTQQVSYIIQLVRYSVLSVNGIKRG